MIFHARQYKLSKIFSKDLIVIIKYTENIIKDLTPYSRYKSVQRILDVSRKELETLKNHKIECDKVVTNKGQIKE